MSNHSTSTCNNIQTIGTSSLCTEWVKESDPIILDWTSPIIVQEAGLFIAVLWFVLWFLKKK